ncbi:hypothetical protein ACFROC_04290 [Nocardia tengchongensis]|uniref:hypothetical protein n=1 Tax=Nocardia tengchongensis TaxID=2055889 RepID=UPI0036BD4BFB
MTTLWLVFLLGSTTGSALTWLVSRAPRRTHRPQERWTVAAITARIEHERTQFGSPPSILAIHNAR